MKVIVTSGPSYEPIDQVRRLTNFSTGELGVLLSHHLARAGFEVFCLKGSGATHPGPDHCELRLFNTNDDLLDLLKELAAAQEIAAVFHVAALCDYRVKGVEDEQGRACSSPKIASRSGALTISLGSTTKVIAKMRLLFPDSVLVGWKYELAGTNEEVLAKAHKQMTECRTDACVVNGRAFGPGFGFCESGFPVQQRANKVDLARFLVAWIKRKIERGIGKSNHTSQPDIGSILNCGGAKTRLRTNCVI